MRLRELLDKARISQQEFADNLNVPRNTVWRWVNGKATPSGAMLQKAAALLNVSVDELLNGPKEGKIEIVLSWDWGEMNEGVLDVEHDEKFTLIVDDGGKLGVKGVGTFKTLEDVKAFGARILAELEDGFNFQVQRGKIAAAGA